MPPGLADYRFAFNRRVGQQAVLGKGNAGSRGAGFVPKINILEKSYGHSSFIVISFRACLISPQ
ncbi:hypothetical protein AGMMS4952_20370 [Spirochaetia bacterium]|nr:hypothetical protein AGMMS4952_20370 [Spirochaetia bacterium]